jgi:outer membrane protein assembly factor BamA
MARLLTTLLVGFLLGQAHLCRAQDPQIISPDRLIITGIEITGNKVTKEFVILRELLFVTGDSILKMEMIPVLQHSRENLLNTSLFNFVFIDVRHLPENRIIVEITVTERWYIWPVPILEYAERNFSEFIKNKEWDKLVYGAYLKWNNFRGRRELLTGKIRLGYINEYAILYEVPNLGKKQQHGITTGFNLSHQNEVFVETVNNVPVEYEPTELPAQVLIDAFGKYSFRRKHYSSHTFRLDYLHYGISDSVMLVNPNYLGDSLTSLNYFTLSYEFKHDVRDSKVYPLHGFMVKVNVGKVGLGIFPDFPYPTLLLTGVLMYHQELARRVYFYNTTKVNFSSEKILPHIMNRGLGYSENLSAYEPYVMDGSDYIITKYNLKFQLVKPATYTIPFIKMEQFNKIHYAIYFNIFADAGFVHNEFPNPTNTMVNNWQYSAGVGLDLVTYYDQVIRIDYAINRYREHGIFFHLETPFYRW